MKFPEKLKPLIDTPKTHNIIEGGRGGGKSRSVSGLIVKILSKCPIKIICGREVQKSLAESSFAMLKGEIYRQGYGKYFDIRESRGVIESAAGGRAIFTGLKEHTVDSIKSYEGFHWAWIEEAQSVSKKSLDVLIPTLRHDDWFKVKLDDKGDYYYFPLRMFIYTQNPFTWDDPLNHVLPESREDVQRITINYWDNPWFPESLEAERKQAEAVMSPEEYSRIWEGIPYESSERAIMSRSDIKAAMSRTASQDGGVVVGADIARFGKDRTVFIKRRGLQVVDVKILSGSDTQNTARVLRDFADGGRIVVDDTGVGGGVTDKLRDMGLNVEAINFGARASDKKKYPDIISEMWFNLAEQLEEIGLPNDQELMTELASRNYSYTRDERRKVESKEEYKKRTGQRSPDKADALILCFYNNEVKPLNFSF